MKNTRRLLQFSKRKTAAGLLLAAVFALVNTWNGGSIPASAGIGALFVLQGPFRLCPGEKGGRVIRVLWAAAVSVAAPYLAQLISGYLQGLRPVVFWTEWLIVSAVWLTVYGLSRNFRLSLSLGLGLYLAPSVIFAYVHFFRGTAMTVSDLLAWRTALNVAGGYRFFPMPVTMLYGLGIYAVIVFSLFALPPFRRKTGKSAGLTAAALWLAVGVIGFGLQPEVGQSWKNDSMSMNGVYLNFLQQWRHLQIEAPEGYDAGEIAALAARYAGEGHSADGDLPTILVVMNESYADFSVLGEPFRERTEEERFFSTLQEDAVKGYALTSVFGGSTANAEWEFLTGCSASAVPQGASPYQQYVEDGDYTVLTELKQLGYHCVSMHPYHADGWNRPAVYQAFGFDKMLFLEDFPQEDLCRDLVSDMEMTQEIIRLYEEKGDEPLFLFGITMQNHSPYDYEGEHYGKTVSLEGWLQEYPEAEQYLSLLRESDRATEELIRYFRDVEEDVVIVFFGDHMPRVEEAFYEEAHGDALDTLEEQLLKYQVPFFVWANYDIPEQEVSCTSLNYLCVYMLEAAGLELPPYQALLKDIMETIPALNKDGYYSPARSAFVSFDEAEGEEAEALALYQALQHNALFDTEGRDRTFFPMESK